MRIVRRLAFGGMAELFVVAMGDADAPFRVIKQSLPHLRDDPGGQRMFLLEGELGLRLRHPHIIHTLAVGRHPHRPATAARPPRAGQPYILLEYLDGIDLSQLLKHQQAHGQRMPLAATLRIGIALAEGLAHLHAGGTGAAGARVRPQIVHRDVTPSNIMLTGDGGVKLIDLGVATVGDDAAVSPGCIKGKLCYMSPEQVSDLPMDGRSDQFSLALVLWECLAGESCFTPGHHFATLLEVARGRVRPIEHFRGDLPAALTHLLARALSPLAADRFDDAALLAQGLRAVASALGLVPGFDASLLAMARRAVMSQPGRSSAPTTRALTTSPLRRVGAPLVAVPRRPRGYAV